jgi:hypothetical protein
MTNTNIFDYGDVFNRPLGREIFEFSSKLEIGKSTRERENCLNNCTDILNAVQNLQSKIQVL